MTDTNLDRLGIEIQSLPPGLIVVTWDPTSSDCLCLKIGKELAAELKARGYSFGPVLTAGTSMESISDQEFSRMGLHRQHELKALRAECEAYRGILGFYADQGNYIFHSPQIYHHERLNMDIVSVRGGVAADDGKKAREILAKYPHTEAPGKESE